MLFAVQSAFLPFAELHYEPELAAWWSPTRAALGALVALVLALDGVLPRAGSWRRRTAFWVSWSVVFLLPTLNLVRQETPWDERFVLLSSLGLAALLAGALARRAAQPRLRRTLVAACGVAAIALAGISLQRSAYYRDALTFERQWAATSPGKSNAHFAFGTALLRAGEIEAARREFAIALRLEPHHAGAQFNLAVALAQSGDLAGAASGFRAVLEQDPHDTEARQNLARLLALLGQSEEASRVRAGP